MRFDLALFLVVAASASTVSPVQKVVELLDECKAKVENDLAAEAKAMDEYTAFCDDESKEKAYNIETATREIANLEAIIEDSSAEISSLSDDIEEIGKHSAGKERELYKASEVRKSEHADFEAAEEEMVKSVKQLEEAGKLIKQSMSLLEVQHSGSHGFKQKGSTRGVRKSFAQRVKSAVQALNGIVEAAWLDASSKRSLKGFLQTAQSGTDSEEDAEAANDLDLNVAKARQGQPQAKQVAYASHDGTGTILRMIEEMQGKAESALGSVRKKEMQGLNAYKMIEQGLNARIAEGQEQLRLATSSKSSYGEKLGKAKGDLVATKKAKAADEEYVATLKQACDIKASDWAERQASAKGELGAISKAKEILVSGVKAFVQVGAVMRRDSDEHFDVDEGDDVALGLSRSKVVNLLKKLGRDNHSYKLMQLSSAAASDPFGKVKGLIEDMIAKLLNEANEDATHEAFCQEEMGKSKKSAEEKKRDIFKFKSRMDEAKAKITVLKEAIKQLEEEVAAIDKAQAEATSIRTEEHNDYVKATKDYRESSEAVTKAMGVLKAYYEGAALIQTSSRQPSFGAAKSDAASGIISILEMSASDFNTLLAEAESQEDQAKDAYEKLTQENKVGKAAKVADAKAKNSEARSLGVALAHAEEDHESVSAELDAVLAYLDKLKPECETKVMSYEERKAAREAEIAGLKEAMTILDGKGI